MGLASLPSTVVSAAYLSCLAWTEILTFHHIGSAPATLVPLVVGCAILLLGSIYEKHTSRDALFPPKMFTNTTVGEFDAEGIFAFC